MPDRGEQDPSPGNAREPSLSLRFAERFWEDLSSVYSDRVIERIGQTVGMVIHNPDIGSPLARPPLLKILGLGIRTVAVAPFVLVYRHDEAAIDFLVLTYGRSIR